MPADDRTLVLTVARAVLMGERGTIMEQIEQQPTLPPLPPTMALRKATAPRVPMAITPNRKAEFFNGWGGFIEDGSEYQIALAPGQWTPAPWSNVMANARFGTLVTESGGGYTWSENCRENRLTAWSNDPVSDEVSEAIYIRDEDTGSYHSPTPNPARGDEAYNVRHGQGYSVFESGSQEIEQHLVVFVPNDDPVKLSKLSLHNRGHRRRRLTVTYYVDWTLGTQRETSAPFVVTDVDTASSVLLAQNSYSSDFSRSVAFIASSAAVGSFTGDRSEFIGRGGNLGRPAAMTRRALSGRVGAGLDPCGAIQVDVDLAPGEQRVVVFMLGEGKSREEVQALVARYRSEKLVSAALEQVCQHWDELLGQIKVTTPDTPFDFLVNRWLVYQTTSSRVLGRTGFYQSGGAYGFRDQLQDAAALVYAAPQLAREQLLRSAGRQFVEGDVQHWWHPPNGKGVRTRVSDDLLWLPYILTQYLEVTGDARILDEIIPFIEAPALEDGHEDAYLLPSISHEVGTLYEHCTRAIERSLRTGAHGLPLMGSGDWNDGMNRVGNGGTGESVWLGWFLLTTLQRFASLCEARDDRARARRYLDHAQALKLALEAHAWDGAWYKRAYFDDGSALGSFECEECRIDSLPQTWSVISGAARPERQAQAMASVEQHLIKYDDDLVLLFTPPFDKGTVDPGYIKGYVPGVRENGGQYTHAAAWVVLAYALLGDGDRAGEIFAMLNPINRTASEALVERYKVEPYVMAADVYNTASHTGRGGWTWYTGSAGWMYRVALEGILGFRLRGARLTLDPCIPSTWGGFSMSYRFGRSTYQIYVENPTGVCRGVRSLELDGVSILDHAVTLIDDGQDHEIRAVLAAPGNKVQTRHGAALDLAQAKT
jgi:cyclic beta-1,2-glucan synthetase